ncbi:TonB-dependent receptor [Bacteroides sedimenti]
MKKSFAILLFLMAITTIKANGFSESIYFVTDKSAYSLNDTMYICGLVLNPDAVKISNLSNYCYLELIDRNAKVLKRSKISCRNGSFSSYIVLDSVSDKSTIFIRAYTKMMQNFSPGSFPLHIIEVGQNIKQAVFLPKENKMFPLQLLYKDGNLSYQYDSCYTKQGKFQLTISAGDGFMSTYSLSEQPLGCVSIIKKPPYLLDCFVTDEADNIVFHRVINVKEEPENTSFNIQLYGDTYKASDTLKLSFPALTKKANILLHIKQVSDINHNNPNFYTQLLQPVVDKGDSYKQILLKKYPYSIYPEQVLSIRGHISKFIGKLKKGSVIAFDNKRSLCYDTDITKDGSFVMGVDDYPEGASFFLQAYNIKGKNNDYEVEIVKDTLPGIKIPPVEWKNKADSTLESAGISWETDKLNWVPEIVIQAKVNKEEPSSVHFYKKNYIDANDIEKNAYNDLEGVFRRLIGVQVDFDEANRPYLRSTRGHSILNQADTNGLRGRMGEVPIILDGIKYGNPDNIFYMTNIYEISSVEFIPPSRANIYGPGNLYGVVSIKTKNGKGLKPSVKSQGINYYPLGLSPNISCDYRNPQFLRTTANKLTECKIVLPSKPGKYQIIVEGLDEGKNIIQDQKEITVL